MLATANDKTGNISAGLSCMFIRRIRKKPIPKHDLFSRHESPNIFHGWSDVPTILVSKTIRAEAAHFSEFVWRRGAAMPTCDYGAHNLATLLRDKGNTFTEEATYWFNQSYLRSRGMKSKSNRSFCTCNSPTSPRTVLRSTACTYMHSHPKHNLFLPHADTTRTASLDWI